MNLARNLLLTILLIMASGCQQAIEPGEQQAELRLQEDDPFATNQNHDDWTTSIDEDNNPFDHTDSNSTPTEKETFSHFETAEFETGDLVPCGNERAEFILEIKAMSGGRCFYQRQQSFCHHRGGETDPRDEPGISPDWLVCAMMSNGFASGTLQYTKLDSQSVTVKIEWSASQGEDSQRFHGNLNVQLNETGDANAGNGNRFAWAFKPVATK